MWPFFYDFFDISIYKDKVLWYNISNKIQKSVRIFILTLYRKKREKKEIGLSAVRGGTIVGEHEVIFAGTDEVIEFKHTAYSKAVFAKGAVEAAKFLSGKAAGMYDMSDVIKETVNM